MRQEEFIRAVEQYTRANPTAVVIHILDNPDGSVAVHAVPNVAGMIDLAKRGAGLTSGQAYALGALKHIHQSAKSEKAKSTKLWLPPGIGSN